mmetsp:Transcript_38497/g.91016  ORF Transcript_38497/g.91016 Transcript_38497/m.91016 type:complete len:238 (-) Transcript_38497:64-777(-)
MRMRSRAARTTQSRSASAASPLPATALSRCGTPSGARASPRSKGTPPPSTGPATPKTATSSTRVLRTTRSVSGRATRPSSVSPSLSDTTELCTNATSQQAGGISSRFRRTGRSARGSRRSFRRSLQQTRRCRGPARGPSRSKPAPRGTGSWTGTSGTRWRSSRPHSPSAASQGHWRRRTRRWRRAGATERSSCSASCFLATRDTASTTTRDRHSRGTSLMRNRPPLGPRRALGKPPP